MCMRVCRWLSSSSAKEKDTEKENEEERGEQKRKERKKGRKEGSKEERRRADKNDEDGEQIELCKVSALGVWER